MTRHIVGAIAFSVALAVAWPTVYASDANSEPGTYGSAEPCLGGVGGVYLLAEPGELAIEVYKRDRNRRGSPAVLRAILVGPDRRVIHEATIPDDGQTRGSGWGPVQQTRISTQGRPAGRLRLEHHRVPGPLRRRDGLGLCDELPAVSDRNVARAQGRAASGADRVGRFRSARERVFCSSPGSAHDRRFGASRIGGENRTVQWAGRVAR
jgi:hypothetical protein